MLGAILNRYQHFGRNTFRNAVITVLFGSIAIVFVFWGLRPQNMGLSNVGSVAEVNGELVSLADLQSETSRLSELYSQYFGNQVPPDAQRQWLQGEALRNLVQLELVAQGAQNMGIVVSDAEIRDQILSLPFLQKDGRFQREYYDSYLGHLGTTPGRFEQRVRKILAQQRMARIFEQALGPQDMVRSKGEELKRAHMNIQFVKLNVGELAKTEVVKDEAVAQALENPEQMQKIESFFRANPDQFRKPTGASSKEKPNVPKDVGPVPEFGAVKTEVARLWLKEQQADAAVRELGELLAKGNKATIDAWVAKRGLKWDETGEFSLAAPRIPKLTDSEVVLKSILALNDQKPFSREIVSDGLGRYVFRLKSRASKDVATPTPFGGSDDFANTQKAQEAMGVWVESLRAKSDVRENLAAIER